MSAPQRRFPRWLPSGRALVWAGLALAVALVLNLKHIATGPEQAGRYVQVVSLVGDPDCSPVGHACRALSEALSLGLRLVPPVVPLRRFEAAVELSGPQAGAVEQVQLEFVMRDMDMGLNRYTMDHHAAGRWRARVTLPVCTAGRTDWRAIVSARSGQTLYRARFDFQAGTHTRP